MGEQSRRAGLPSLRARPLTRGEAVGVVLALADPLSFWGGVDAHGRIIDVHHRDHGLRISGTVLVFPGGRGSSSSSSVLAELIRSGQAPAALVVARPDPIIALAALVADELYGLAVPVVLVSGDDLRVASEWTRARVHSDPGRGTASVARC